MSAYNNSVYVEAMKDILAGTVGGLTTVLVGHPLDTIKVRLQASTEYSGIMQVVRETNRLEGVFGFYRGVWSPLLGEGFFSAAQFAAWGLAKTTIINNTMHTRHNNKNKNNNNNNNNYNYNDCNLHNPYDLTRSQYFLAGAMTGAASGVVETPIDFVKSQLQVQIFRAGSGLPVQFTTFKQATALIYNESGIRGFFQGFTATLCRSIPGSAAYFGVYEGVRTSFLSDSCPRREQLTAGPVLLAGGLGGLAYWIVCFPFDSIKSTIQGDDYRRDFRRFPPNLSTTIASSASASASSSATATATLSSSSLSILSNLFRNSAMVTASMSLYQSGGIKRFYRGMAPCMLRAFPANAACFYAYETSRALL